jgi:hypothetical protein
LISFRALGECIYFHATSSAITLIFNKRLLLMCLFSFRAFGDYFSEDDVTGQPVPCILLINQISFSALSYSKGLIRSQKISCYCPFKALSNTNYLIRSPGSFSGMISISSGSLETLLVSYLLLKQNIFAKITHIFLLNSEKRVCKLILFPVRHLKPFQAHIIC